ncbi:MAG TPA: DUF4097 family beta strand repeat-containing protein [Thermoanaerobaculia bacterium]|nr:DUF4097 family beta strand repeat-containing protein [Thermoanaerobaculia bacterium]
MAAKTLLRTLLAGAAALAALAATSTLRGDSMKKQWQKQFDLPAGGSLVIRNDVGRITVGPSPDGRVHVDIAAAVSGRQADQAFDELGLDISESSGSVRIQRRKGWREHGLWDGLFGRRATVEIDYRVQVPDGLVLDLHTANGKVELDGVEGVLGLGTANGDVVVRRAAGAVSGTTVNGRIDVEVDRVDPGARMRFDTVNGRIRTRLPRDLCAELDASSQNGAVKVDFPVRTRGTMRRNGVVGDVGECATRVSLSYRSINGNIQVLEG